MSVYEYRGREWSDREVEGICGHHFKGQVKPLLTSLVRNRALKLAAYRGPTNCLSSEICAIIKSQLRDFLYSN